MYIVSQFFISVKDKVLQIHGLLDPVALFYLFDVHIAAVID